MCVPTGKYEVYNVCVVQVSMKCMVYVVFKVSSGEYGMSFMVSHPQRSGYMTGRYGYGAMDGGWKGWKYGGQRHW